ncbi:TetR/AcrR family transcriptional regulator [Streptomyces sp. NPDC012751]|uniref:TetR/AcrR family transcriptional regulator n=1 Tax=Streptomyces sp. NPDC012751 TaxID=3364846 RepID=UPI0036AFB181
MSTTPSTAHQPFSASAPVSLTERRKAETRMEIARAAAALFVRQGLRATRAEDIAQAAGIAPRTFYRYFATKEEAVAPLYAAGAQRWIEAVRTAPADLSPPQALEYAVRHTLTPGLGVSAASWDWLRTLIRLTDTSPALRKVWAEVCQASEGALAEILAERMTGTEDDGAAGTPSGPGTETAAGTETEPETDPVTGDGVAETRTRTGTRTGTGTGADPEPGGSEAMTPGGAEGGGRGGDEAGGRRGPVALAPAAAGRADARAVSARAVPELRFAAAVAGAAVRVAVEGWAVTTAPPAGPGGPAALAVRNLRALRDFAWSGEE